MKKNIYLFALGVLALGVTSCKKEVSTQSEVENYSIKLAKQVAEDFPFADSLSLKSFDGESSILSYKFARKLSLMELLGTGKIEEMKWSGCKLSELPVVIYGFDSKPKYYEFIVLDPENRALGMVTAYARKKSSTIIREISSAIPDYGNKITKSGNVKLFQDWMGNDYIGVPSKSGESPTAVFDENGNVATGVQELTDEQIVAQLSKTVLAEVRKQNDSLYLAKKDTFALLPNGAQLAELYKKPLSSMVDSLQSTMAQEHKETAYYWTEIASIQDSIDVYGDDELIEKSTKGIFGRIFRRLFSGVDETRYVLAEYDNNRANYRRGGEFSSWCGPWVAGFIYNTKIGGDAYQYFENCSSSTGLLGTAWFWFRVLGDSRPMFPAEFAWSMLLATNGSISVNPILKFPGYIAYDQIKHSNSPVIRMCTSDGELHWTLCYGTYQTGSYFWRNYYYLQTDNGSKFNRARGYSNWEQMDWYMPFLLVED